MSRTISFFVVISMFTFVQRFEVAPDDFNRILTDEGYTNIQNTGYDALACSSEDALSSGFIATRHMSDGTTRSVSGAVCCGSLFKSCTIRH